MLRSRYGFEPHRIAKAIEMLLAHDRISLEAPPVVAAALASFRAHPKLGFSDCLILAVARQAGHHPLGTFDRELGRLPGAQRL